MVDGSDGWHVHAGHLSRARRTKRLGSLSVMTETTARSTPTRMPSTASGSTTVEDALEGLSAAVGAVAGVLDVEPVLQLIVDRVRVLVHAKYAALGIVDGDGHIERFITSGITPEERALLGPPPEGHGLLGLIIREGRPIRIPDIAAHPARSGFPPNHPPMRSLLGVPVRVKQRTIGDLYLTDKTTAAVFSDRDQHLVELFALHAGIAIENARLHEAVARLAVSDERDRIGKDLHDGIIQSIYGVALSLEDVPELMTEAPQEATARVDRAIDALNATIGELRNFIFGLRPEHLDGADLKGLLAAITERIRQASLIDIELEILTAPEDLPMALQTELFQIAREALSNVARHSRATRAWLTVRRDGTDIVLELRDNGVGFIGEPVAEERHYGLVNMRSRAEALGGRLDLTSTPNAGTHLIVRVPA